MLAQEHPTAAGLYGQTVLLPPKAVHGLVMLANQRIWMKKRDELQARRAALLQSYADKPNDSGLALQLKILDESIMQCTRNMEEAGQLIVAARSSRNP